MPPPVGASRAGGCHDRGLIVGSSSTLIISNTVARRSCSAQFSLRTGSGPAAHTEMLLFPSRGQEFQNSDPSKQLRFDLSAGDPEAIFGHTSCGNRLGLKVPLLFLECGAHFRRLHSEVNFPAVARAPKYYDSYDLAGMALRPCQK